MNDRYRIWLLVLALALTGCEYAFSDVATRIRYRLLDAMSELQRSKSETISVALRPDHWPDECPKEAGYRLVISPYKGGKQVATGDIVVSCRAGREYYTGLGSERLYVTRELAVEKKKDDEVRLTLRKTPSGVEIVSLE